MAFLLAFGGLAPAEALRFEVSDPIVRLLHCMGKARGRKGYAVEAKNMPVATLVELKIENDIRPEMTSCHTAKVAGYTIEGHVPMEDIERLVRQKPETVGLSADGMPIGSPGMEHGRSRDRFDVLLINSDGTTAVVSSYPAIEG